MTHWPRFCRATVLAVALLGASGCADESSEPDPGSEGTEVEFTVVVSDRRQEPPTGDPGVDFTAPPRTEAEVTADLASSWPAWSTIGSANDVPQIADGSVAILVWDSGKRFEITSLTLRDAGLVVSAQRVLLGRGCLETDEIGGTTTVLATDDPAVSAQTPIADIVVTEVDGPDCE